VEEIIISDLKEGVFFAKIVCSDGLNKTEIDARPSDAIAIGLRFDATIYTYETILAEAGIVLTDQEEEDDKEKAQPKETKPKAKKETVKMTATLLFSSLVRVLSVKMMMAITSIHATSRKTRLVNRAVEML
jgi:bifunctional DNase/RNase